MHARGVGVTQDYDRAVELFEEACYGRRQREHGSRAFAESCVRVGDMFANGEGVERDLYRAARYFRRACALGYEEACRRS